MRWFWVDITNLGSLFAGNPAIMPTFLITERVLYNMIYCACFTGNTSPDVYCDLISKTETKVRYERPWEPPSLAVSEALTLRLDYNRSGEKQVMIYQYAYRESPLRVCRIPSIPRGCFVAFSSVSPTSAAFHPSSSIILIRLARDPNLCNLLRAGHCPLSGCSLTPYGLLSQAM